jgi:hypothetical protein
MMTSFLITVWNLTFDLHTTDDIGAFWKGWRESSVEQQREGRVQIREKCKKQNAYSNVFQNLQIISCKELFTLFTALHADVIITMECFRGLRREKAIRRVQRERKMRRVSKQKGKQRRHPPPSSFRSSVYCLGSLLMSREFDSFYGWV